VKAAPTRTPAAGPATRRRATVVDWSELTVTSRCNQRCFFCYEDARAGAADPSRAQLFRLLRETRRRSEQVVFCGREALLRPDLPELVAYACRRGLRTVVFTNGQALARPDLVARLADAGCSGVTVSFHFPDAATFARGARVNPRGFERILAGLRNLRDHNRSRPERPLAVSTETDMFSLNAGRLQELRGTLLEALGASGWSMRLAGLLPMQVHDIGLPSVVESLDARREELDAFVRTHPPGVPLGFVKVPLCLLPEGREHHSLDVQYVHAGTRMSFNHLDPERLEVDRLSVNDARALEPPLRRHPYRWLCRTCTLLPLCRFERLSWSAAGFLPERSGRPVPYRSRAPVPVRRSGPTMPYRVGSAARVLARLGPSPAAARRAAAVARSAAGRPFPEEQLLRALDAAVPGQPTLVEAWVDRTPILVVELAHGRRRLRLGLDAPGLPTTRPGALVDYLFVRPLPGGAASPELLRRALRRLAAAALPEPARWSADSWFDAPTARRRQAAWRVLGELLWPGVGRLGPWRCVAVHSEPSCDVLVRLAHPGGAVAELVWRSDDAASALPFGVTLERLDARTPTAGVLDLLGALQRRLTGRAGAPPTLPAAARRLALQLRRDRWEAEPLPAATSVAGPPPAADELVLHVRRGDTPVAELHVVRTRDDRPAFRRVGPLSLWYGQAALDGPALQWADLALDAAHQLQDRPLDPTALPAWRAVLAALVRRQPWTRGFRWRLEWRAAAGALPESPADG
jgi:uncharacterized Fe-S cluster-containing radical SAM superfamily protein